MAIAAEPIAAEAGSLGAGAAGGEEASSKAGNPLGFSGGQKAGAIGAGVSGTAKLLPRPKTTHPYLVGLIFVAIGLAGMVGSITGSLPAMIAALWDPPILVDKTGASVAPGFLGSVGEIAAGVTNINPLQEVEGWVHLGGNIF